MYSTNGRLPTTSFTSSLCYLPYVRSNLNLKTNFTLGNKAQLGYHMPLCQEQPQFMPAVPVAPVTHILSWLDDKLYGYDRIQLLS